MKYAKLIAFILALWSTSASASVSCSDVQVNIQTALNATYHGFHEVGITGSMLFISVSPDSCVDSGGATLSDSIYMVIEDIENADGLKKLWFSMLLSAQASNKSINFSATDSGTNSKGRQVLVPYYLTVNL